MSALTQLRCGAVAAVDPQLLVGIWLDHPSGEVDHPGDVLVGTPPDAATVEGQRQVVVAGPIRTKPRPLKSG